MASEIRANTIKNRVGLGTVSYTNTGIVVSGIVTANSFSGPISGTTGTFSGDVDINGDLDVDGHTNLDNVSIAGVSTFSGNSTFNDEIVISNANPTIVFDQTSGTLPDNQYRMRGGGGKLTLQVSSNNGASYSDAVSIGGIGNIFIPDDDKVYFGTNNDAYIQHDNSNLNVVSTTGNIIIKRGSDVGNIIQMNGADTTSELLEAGITSGHVQFTATHASGGSNTCGFIFRTRHGSGGTTEKLRIESGGGLKFTGQGTSIPVGGILHHTNNNLYVRGGTSGLILGNQDNTTTVQIYNNFIRFETDDGTEKLLIDENGKITHTAATNTVATLDLYGGNTTVSAVGEVNAQIRFRSKDISVTNAEENVGGSIKSIVEYSNGAYVGLSFETYKQDRTPRLQEAVRIRHDGKVGIGTDNPQTKLEIAGATTNVLGYSDGHVQIVGNSPIAFVSQSNLNPALNRWGFKLASNSDGDFSIYDYRHSKNRFLINSSGKIGIGEDDPAYPLEVVGDGGGSFAASSNSTNGVLSVVGKNSSGSISAISRIKSYPDTNSNQSHMAFETRNSSAQMVEAIRISSSQKVGIGTDNPSTYKLHLQGSTSALARFERTGGAFAKVDIKAGSSSGNSYLTFSDPDGSEVGEINYEHADNSLRFGTAGAANRMKIDSDGYVTKPQTPAFFATHTGAGNSIIGTLTYNTSGNGYYNNGGHLNVGTGRFTAPVDGIYTFHFHGFFQVNQSSNYFEVGIKRTNSNGGGANTLTRHYGYRDQPTNQYGPSISMHCTTYLTAGQRVEVTTSGLSFHGSNGYFFGGHLVG